MRESTHPEPNVMAKNPPGEEYLRERPVPPPDRAIFELFFQNLPVPAVLLDENMCIVETTTPARKFPAGPLTKIGRHSFGGVIACLETYRIFALEMGMPPAYGRFSEVTHPGDREYVDKNWQDRFRKVPYNVEYGMIAGDKVKWAGEKAQVKFDDTGGPYAV